MRERGKGGIIFISSTVAFSGTPAWSNYAATKAYDLTLADGIARELGRDTVIPQIGTQDRLSNNRAVFLAEQQTDRDEYYGVRLSTAGAPPAACEIPNSR